MVVAMQALVYLIKYFGFTGEYYWYEGVNSFLMSNYKCLIK